MAKKPLNGHSCASCEHYLGELSTGFHTFTPYNKIQSKESEKQYRVNIINLFIYLLTYLLITY